MAFIDIDKCIVSFLGPNKSCKFIDENGFPTVVGCIEPFLKAIYTKHPVVDVIETFLNSHHKQFGCGSTTLFAMSMFWYKALVKRKSQGIQLNSVMQELDNVMKITIKSLSSITLPCAMRLKSIIQSEIKVNYVSHTNSYLRYSRHLQSPLEETNNSKTVIKNAIHNIVSSVSHGSEWIVNLLVEVWQKQIDIWDIGTKFDASTICTATMESSQINHCVISGLILKVKYETASHILNKKSWKAMLINGNVNPNFIHKGVNLSLNVTPIETVTDSYHTDLQNWISRTLGIIHEFGVDLLLTSGKVDDKLQSALTKENIAVIENVSTRTLESIADIIGCSLISCAEYCDEGCTAELDLTKFALSDDTLSTEYWIQLYLPKLVQTVVICHPMSIYLSHLEHCFWHAAHRLSSISQNDAMLPGSGETENFVLNNLKSTGDMKSESLFLAQEILGEGFSDFVRVVKDKLRLFNITTSTFDDYISKVNGWKSALNLACLLTQIDYVLTDVDSKFVEDFSNNLNLIKL